MGKLIYSAIASLDGYVADESGDFDWSAPDEELHGYINDRERSIGTYLYGRRMYDVMVVWEAAQTLTDQPAVIRDYARIWRSAEKIVYSTTLEAAASAKTRIESRFDADAVRELKSASERDISVGGPELAGQAMKAGLVDECHVFLTPIVVGGGNGFLPKGVRLSLDLIAEHQFSNGVVHLGYRVTN
jgi:dihydrofolate reductase